MLSTLAILANAEGKILCRMLISLSKRACIKGRMVGESDRPGEITLLCDVGTMFMVALWKSLADISIDCTSSSSLSVDEYICGYLLLSACNAASVHRDLKSAPQ